MRLLAAAVLCLSTQAAPATLINFDDRPGDPVTRAGAMVIPPEYIINTQYSSLGVVFNSTGGGIRIINSTNPVSAPNLVSPTGLGPVVDYFAPTTANFFLSGQMALVDTVSLTLSNTSVQGQSVVLTAYALDGSLLGATTAFAPQTMQLSFAGQIHSIRLTGGPYAFDNFQFEGLAIPAPASLLILLAAARRRRDVRSRP